MKLPQIRFTVRRMMVVVALVAAVLGFGGWVHRRSETFWRLAEYHATMGGVSGTSPAKANWHHAMWSKYIHAYSYPLFPVEPDSPEPR